MSALEREIIRLTGGVAALRHVVANRRTQMTPKLRGALSALVKLKHAIEADADKLANRVEGVDVRRVAAFDKAHGAVAAAETGLRDIESYVDELERTNSGPLEEPSESSAPRSSDVATRRI